jgi:transmembrane sensor
MTSPDDEGSSDPLLEEAMDWLLALEEQPRDPELSARCAAWRARSRAHERAFDAARRSWRALGAATPAFAHVWAPAAPSRIAQRSPAPSRRRRTPFVFAEFVGAALLLCILLVAAPSVMLRLEADQITGAGETRVVSLADGSRVTLGAKSAIRSDFSVDRRSVALLSGEAYFEVAKDSARPFVVDAEGVDVVVHGTAFDIRLASATTTVALERGSVSLAYGQGAARREAMMAPGEEIAIHRAAGTMTRRRVEPGMIAIWRDGRLFVQEARLGDVAEQLQRHAPGWIAVADAALADCRVTGLYDLRDPDRALRALVEPFGGRLRVVTPYVRVLSLY